MPALYIRLLGAVTRDDDGAHLDVQWVRTDDDGALLDAGATDARGLGDLIDPDAAWTRIPQNIVVIAPGELLLSVMCQVPGRSTGQIRRALPFVVEEHLASDIEHMHLAHGPIRRGEPVTCVAVEEHVLAAWLDVLHQAGVFPGYLVSDAQLLPLEEGAITLLFDDDAALVRYGEQSASVDTDIVPMALASLLADFPEGETVAIRQIGGQIDAAELAQLEVLAQAEHEPLDGSALAYLAQRCRDDGAADEAVNLLQGTYAPARQTDPKLDRWRSVAMLGGVAILLGVLSMSTKAWWAGTQADSLEAETATLFKDIFPDARPTRNIRRELANRLGQRTDDSAGFLVLLDQLAAALDAGVKVRSMNYAESRGEMTTEIVLDNFDQLESVKTRLQDQGVAAEVASAEQAEEGVRARLRIKDA